MARARNARLMPHACRRVIFSAPDQDHLKSLPRWRRRARADGQGWSGDRSVRRDCWHGPCGPSARGGWRPLRRRGLLPACRRSWKWTPVISVAVTAGIQTRLRKTEWRSSFPSGLVNSRPSYPGRACSVRWSSMTGTTGAGMMTTRRPAAVLGGAKNGAWPLTSVSCRVMRTVAVRCRHRAGGAQRARPSAARRSRRPGLRRSSSGRRLQRARRPGRR
jgi:hypothetical protein